MIDQETVLELDYDLDFARSYGLHLMGGRRTVTGEAHEDRIALALNTPEGPAFVRVWRERPHRYRVQCTGDGRGLVISRVRGLVGAEDQPGSFTPVHPRVAEWHRRSPRLRLVRLPVLFDSLVQLVLQQRVRWREASRSYRALVRRYGAPAPGSEEYWVPPAPGVLAGLASHEYAACGVERNRSETIRRLAISHRRVEEAWSMTPTDAPKRLSAFRGVGPWTTEFALGLALGDPDAAPTGDAGLPHDLAWALSGRPRSNDDEMLELLEPFRGHRFRVIRLMHELAGHAPRFGPKAKPGAAPGHLDARRRGKRASK